MIPRIMLFFLMFLFLACQTKTPIYSVKPNQKKIVQLLQRLRIINTAFDFTKVSILDPVVLAVIFQKSTLHYAINQKDSAFIYGKILAKEQLNFKNVLWNTEKRNLAIGGTITFESEKGNGFKTQIIIPM